MTAVSLGTFGLPEVHAGDRPIKLNLRKGLALLIYLAEAQGAVARDVIATLLWPESPGETARTRLRRLLHRIELTLGRIFSRLTATALRRSSGGRTEGYSRLFESACERAAATSPLESGVRMRLVSRTEGRAERSSAAHQKEGPDRALKTRTGDAQVAFRCRRPDVHAMREKS